ncbi:MAG TPA: hypothetical protein VGC95_14030, partial [Chitinophagaceae bacterium]
MTTRIAAVLIVCNLSGLSLAAKRAPLQAQFSNSRLDTTKNDNPSHIDPSRPTNFYNRLSSNVEYNYLSSGKRT